MKKTSSPKGLSRKTKLGALVVSGVAVGSMLWLGMSGSQIQVPAYEVARVIDGDTFETKEKQLIRLSAVDAPELSDCGGMEAKKALESLIVGKPVYLKALYRDQFFRLNSLVYADGVFVNESMIRAGKGKYNDRENIDMKILDEASGYAKKRREGIYGSECTQTTNQNDPSCLIKGNNVQKQGEARGKLYHLPSCAHYAIVQMQMYEGDEWFCSEKEAQEAGYIKAGGCPDHQ